MKVNIVVIIIGDKCSRYSILLLGLRVILVKNKYKLPGAKKYIGDNAR